MQRKVTAVREDVACGGPPEPIADKWRILVIAMLRVDAMPFGELHACIGVLSESAVEGVLRSLERDGLVVHSAASDGVAQVTYELTRLGRSLPARADALGGWAAANQGELLAARARYDASA